MNPLQALRFPADSTGLLRVQSVGRPLTSKEELKDSKSQERIGKTLPEPQRGNPQYHHKISISPTLLGGGGGGCIRQGEKWPPAKGIQTETRLLAEATQEDQAFKRQVEELLTIAGSEDAKTEDDLGQCIGVPYSC